jgi:hypothetical protein
MKILAEIFLWLNKLANFLGQFLLAPVTWMPGWLSNTLYAIVAGIIMLVVFKYTSNQKAIGKIKDQMKAGLLALKLYKDFLPVTFQSQGILLACAAKQLVHAIIPLLVMSLPICLLLAQLGLWYQFRPLRSGEQALVTATLNSPVNAPWPEIDLKLPPGTALLAGPCRVNKDRQEIWWTLQAGDPGHKRLAVMIDDEPFDKELVIGTGLQRVSALRPGRQWLDLMLHPSETPFESDSRIQSIEIAYPSRESFTHGTDMWVIYFFIVSMAGALLFKPWFDVKI